MSQSTSFDERSLTDGGPSAPSLQVVPDWMDAARGLAARFEEVTGRSPSRSLAVARDLAAKLGLAGPELGLLEWSVALYDVGMLSVPGDVVGKGGCLDGGDLAHIRRHPTASAEMILRISSSLAPVAAAARSHHEHWDGRGYPDGLSGHEIPLHGRILALADTYDALTSFRPLRQGVFTDSAVREYFMAESGKRFDPSLVSAFLGPHADDERRSARALRRRKA